MNYSRSWFQTPNSYDSLNVQNVVSGGTSASPVFGNVGNADQHSKIGTINVSPTYTRIVSNNSVFNLGAFVRKDEYNYYPQRQSRLADLGPANLQTSSISQYRTLTNSAVHSDYSYSKGIHTFKAGAQYGQTFLRENDSLGVVDPTYSFSAPCVDAERQSAAGLLQSVAVPRRYGRAESQLPIGACALRLYARRRLLHYAGHTDVKELGLFAEDQIKAGELAFNLGLREDVYNGLTRANQTQPRVGVAYNIKPTQTCCAPPTRAPWRRRSMRTWCSRAKGCSNPVLAPLLACTSGVAGTLQPGFRNEFHAGLQQAFGKRVVVSGEYIWKYTHNAFDFSVLGNTPITFPIDWHNSKIPGYALHVECRSIHNISAYVVASSVAARFFPPQVAGAGATVGDRPALPHRPRRALQPGDTRAVHTSRTGRR
jgi:hypothetical protein